MNWYLDVFAEDYIDTHTSALAAIRRCQDEDRSGPCEDDAEVAAPFVGLLPEETDQARLVCLFLGISIIGGS